MFYISASYFVAFGFAKLFIFMPDQVGNFSGLLKTYAKGSYTNRPTK